MQRIPTGFKKLDAMLEGGFPDSSVILLKGSVGMGKSIIAMQLAGHMASQGRDVIYITTNLPPEKVIEKMKFYGIKNFEKIKFIDCYTWKAGGIESIEKSKYDVVSITDLTKLSYVISKNGLIDGKKVLIFDSISDLFLQLDERRVTRFLQVLIAKIVEFDSLGLFLIDDIGNQKVDMVLDYLTYGCIELKKIEDRTKIVVRRMIMTKMQKNEIDYIVTDKGVEIET